MPRFGLRGRMTLYVSCLVLGLFASTFVLLGRKAEQRIRAEVLQDLTTTQRVFDEYLRLRETDLTSHCRLLADSPRLIAAVDTHDPPTVLDLVSSLREDIRCDLFTVTDAQGVVLAQTDAAGRSGERLRSLPFIRKAMLGEDGAAFFQRGDQLYQVTSSPLRDPQLRTMIGTLTIGFRIDDILAGTLKRITRSEVAFLQDWKVTAATLPAETWPDLSLVLETAFGERRPVEEGNEVRLGERRFLGLRGVLPDGAGGTAGTYVILRSLDRQARFLREVRGILAILGSAGILTAILASYLLARGMTRPINRLTRAARRISEGDLTARVQVRSSDEIGDLGADFNRMAESLRTSRHDLESLNDDLENQVAQRTEELASSLIRLQEISRLKSEFLANMSHELRTPLNAIIGFADLIGHPAFGRLTPEQADHADTILRNARHLLHLINDVLDLSKIEAGKVEVQYGLFSVARALEDVRDLTRSLVDAKGLRLTGFPLEDLLLVADETKFKQIVVNLLSNAVKFTPSGGRIEIRARRVDERGDGAAPSPSEGQVPEWVEVSVADTGIGIRREDLERVFDAFEQVDGSMARVYEGTGLGLALTRRLVELQGGRIWVTSEFGRGSTFTFRLPSRRAAQGFPEPEGVLASDVADG